MKEKKTKEIKYLVARNIIVRYNMIDHVERQITLSLGDICNSVTESYLFGDQLKPMILYKLLVFWYPIKECFAQQQGCNTNCKFQAFPNLLSCSSYSPF